MIIERLNSSFILYENNPTYYIRDYYNFIVSKLRLVISNMSVNVILGNYMYDFGNLNRTFKVHINYEHTLVKFGGRDSEGSPFGTTTVLNMPSEPYLIRLTDHNLADSSDIYIDYSMPNIMHLSTNDIFKKIAVKSVYIPPVLYDLHSDKKDKSIDILTTFINTDEPRRKLLMNELIRHSLPHININTCFDKDSLKDLYSSTKIILNIHQTDHHHTFEELRVLPALLSGVIVICEESPLKEHIPYKDYVVWCNYDEIINVTKDVLSNYEKYYELLFSSKLNELRAIINSLHIDITVNLSKALKI